LKASLIRQATELGFDVCRVVHASQVPDLGPRLEAWIAAGYHADMEWMAETLERRAHATQLWPEVRSVIMLGMNYGPEADPLATLALKDRGNISVYARGRDYHDLIKGRLKLLAHGLLASRGADAEVKVFVDTAPVMEKALAQAAGLGWQGKHTVLISRDLGNWLFLGAICTTLELEADSPETDHCGSCRKCLDICPTAAFPEPYVLDSRRCISYLTIEHKGHIPVEFREAMGNRIFGCDDCLAVCPWNKFAQTAKETKLLARADRMAPRLAELAALDEASFRAMFAGSPIKRTGRDRFLRNVLIAIGNSGEVGLAGAAERALGDPSPLVRAMAVWALARLLPADQVVALRQRHSPAEADEAVKAEWARTHAINQKDPGTCDCSVSASVTVPVP
jgi:epoxyqueuosine reductase